MTRDACPTDPGTSPRPNVSSLRDHCTVTVATLVTSICLMLRSLLSEAFALKWHFCQFMDEVHGGSHFVPLLPRLNSTPANTQQPEETTGGPNQVQEAGDLRDGHVGQCSHGTRQHLLCCGGWAHGHEFAMYNTSKAWNGVELRFCQSLVHSAVKTRRVRALSLGKSVAPVRKASDIQPSRSKLSSFVVVARTTMATTAALLLPPPPVAAAADCACFVKALSRKLIGPEAKEFN